MVSEKSVKIFVTSDGEEFDTKQDAEDHELEAFIRSVYNPEDRSCFGDARIGYIAEAWRDPDKRKLIIEKLQGMD